MDEKVNLDRLSLDFLDLRTVIKPDKEHIASKLTGIWNDANLLRLRVSEHIQPPASDLRMIVRSQRKNKHPHSTKKHK